MMIYKVIFYISFSNRFHTIKYTFEYEIDIYSILLYLRNMENKILSYL